MFASGCDIDEDGAMFPIDTTYIYVLFMSPPFVSRDMIYAELQIKEILEWEMKGQVAEAGEDGSSKIDFREAMNFGKNEF